MVRNEIAGAENEKHSLLHGATCSGRLCLRHVAARPSFRVAAAVAAAEAKYISRLLRRRTRLIMPRSIPLRIGYLAHVLAALSPDWRAEIKESALVFIARSAIYPPLSLSREKTNSFRLIGVRQ